MRDCVYTIGRVLGVLLLSLSLVTHRLVAQETVSLGAGTRIRVTAPVLKEQLPHPSFGSPMWGDRYSRADPRIGRATGTVLSVDPDSLIVQLQKGKIRAALPWNGIEVLERYPGGRVRAALVGGLIGVSAGAALGWSMGAECPKQWPTTTLFYFSPQQAAVLLGMYAGGVGAAIGASYVPD